MIVVACLWLEIAPSAAVADADGPDFLRVVGVEAGDVLNIHSDPSAKDPVVGSIPPDGDGIRNLGCTGALTFEQFQKATDAEKEAARHKQWCKVAYAGVSGWAAGRFLGEGGSPGTTAEAAAEAAVADPPAEQKPLACKVDESAGFELEGSDWKPVSKPNADAFDLTPVRGPVCGNEDFNCQAQNPNYRLTSSSLGDDFVGCYRHAFLDFMSCDVFSSTLKVNFAKGVFVILDDGGLIADQKAGGAMHVRVGRCIPKSEP